MKRLLLLRRFPEADRALIRERLAGRYEVIDWPGDDGNGRVAAAAAGAEVMLGNSMPTGVLAAARELRLLQVAGAGVDRLDLAALTARGVVVCNSHSNAPFVAETAVALALALVKNTCRRDRGIRAGDWRPGPAGTLLGRTAGFFGFGHVGRHILRLLAGFRPAAVAWSRDIDPGDIAGLPPVEFLGPDEVLARADILFLCLPLTPDTRGCIMLRELRLLGPAGFLVNVARAGLVNEDDLYRALAEDIIAGAGLDVWEAPVECEGRKLPSSRPFHELDNVVLSPYCAGAAVGAPHLTAALDNLARYADTGRLESIISPAEGY